ncbi:MAG: NADH:ubiquinone reductase (Na(+)-transporting) subunit C [Bacteroidales bacterium]|nr:NADH:ubiquinone reductase (Na(+)-transporting) subunit C [Bacteroidales bacterium]
MNTNSNIYTVIYTAVVVVIVAAVLAFVSQKLGPMQAANEKAETVSQILTAAQFGDKESWAEKGNAATLDFYRENVEKAVTVNAKGEETGVLDIQKVAIYSVSQLKTQNYNIKDGKDFELPVYIFKNGTKVIPVYGAGLWGPVWGYIALEPDNRSIVGAYFDHEGETPGLGGKIKDDPSFRAQFVGKQIDYSDAKPFSIIKGGAKGKANAVDAITGATMTSKGLDAAIVEWLGAYEHALFLEELFKMAGEGETLNNEEE